MKSRTAKYRAATPLNTQDVTRLAGTSRRMLDHYERMGLLVPNRVKDTEKAKKQWSVDQAKFTERVRILQHGNKSIEEITALADQGADTFLDVFQMQCSQDIREGWRQLKAAVIDQSRCLDSQMVGTRGQLYLRYLPQRWYVLLAIDGAEGLLPHPGTLGRAYVDLHSVAHVVGWCTASASGVLTSMDDDGEGQFTSYAFIELATPPMPEPDMLLPHDSGCYCEVMEPDERPACYGRCNICSRYGREPTTEERFYWKTEENTNPGQWRHTLMLSDMAAPYEYGVWSGSTIGNEHGGWDLAAFRPRLMPHEVRLPLGVTACSVPAGVYLCTQCDDEREAETCQRLMGALMAVQHREFSHADEEALRAREARKRESESAAHHTPGPSVRHESGPVHPFSKRLLGDDAGLRWLRELQAGDLRKLTVPTNMGLFPENGLCMSCATLPTSGRNDVPHLELRVLVDPGDLGPEGGLGLLWES